MRAVIQISYDGRPVYVLTRPAGDAAQFAEASEFSVAEYERARELFGARVSMHFEHMVTLDAPQSATVRPAQSALETTDLD